jgi:3-hydroxyacyl-CoA dehydrogenase
MLAWYRNGLTTTDIQAKCESHPERCVIGHPFNPPHVIPLVEVVGDARTSDETIARAMKFYALLGKNTYSYLQGIPGTPRHSPSSHAL